MKKHIRGSAVFFAIVVLASLLYAQAVRPKYQPSDSEMTNLKLAFAEAQVAQRDVALAQVTLNDKLGALNAAGQKVIAHEKWPSEVKFDVNHLTFCDTLIPGPNGMQCPAETVPVEPPKKK